MEFNDLDLWIDMLRMESRDPYIHSFFGFIHTILHFSILATDFGFFHRQPTSPREKGRHVSTEMV